METNFTAPNFFSADALAYWDSLTKASVASSKQLESLNMKLTEKLMQKQTELFNSAVNAGNQALALLGEGKALPEILAEQGKLTTDFGNKLFAYTREASEIIVASQAEYRSWFEQGFKNLTEKAQAAASALTPATLRKAA
jgi:phasin family protein